MPLAGAGESGLGESLLGGQAVGTRKKTEVNPYLVGGRFR